MALLLGACSPDGPTTSESQLALTGQTTRSRSNTLVRLPYGQYLADIDGDGLAELVSVNGNKVFVNRIDQAGTGVGHHYFDQNVREVAFGRFTAGVDRQELCAAMDNGTIECLRWVSADQRFTVWLSHGPNFNGNATIAAPSTADRMIVGDFDGNGVEELMLHNPTSGVTTFLVATDFGCTGNGFCGLYFVGKKATYTSTASGFNLSNKEVYAGKFGTSAQRTDLLIVDRSTGKGYRFDSATGTGSFFTTLRLVGTTASNEISSSEVLAIANVDANASNTDALVTYTPATGASRILRVTTGSHYQTVPGMPSTLVGTSPAGSRLIFAKTANWNEPGSTVREGFVAYDAGQQIYLRFDARFTSNANVYQPAFAGNIRRFDLEFLALAPSSPWLILMCRDNDVPAGPGYAIAPFKWYYAQEGRDIPSFYNYIKDMSYGQYNYVPTVQGVVTIPTGQSLLGRDAIWNMCVQQSGVTPSQYQHVVVTTNGVDDYGQGSSAAVVTLDGRANLWSTNADHELGHNLGLPHAHNTSASGCGGSPDPGEYCDSLDPMGMDSAYLWDGSAYPIAGPTPVNIQVTVGAGYGGVSRIKLGWIPTARQQNFQRVATPTTETVDLAALDRPEAAGALVATVQTTSDENDYYVIELRTKAGRWDKALATDGVAVRHQMINPSYPTKGYVGYLAVTATRPLGLFLAGDSIVLGGVTVNVVSLDAANGRARVTITH